MKIASPSGARPRIEMLPLIDVVFLLLAVFIHAMLSMAVHRGMPLDLPASRTAAVDLEKRLTVSVAGSGAIQVDGAPVALDRLEETLRARAEPGAAPAVQVFGDRELSLQRLLQVLDRIRLAGFEQISLQTAPEPGP